MAASEYEAHRGPIKMSTWALEEIRKFRDTTWKVRKGSGRPPSLAHALDTILDEWADLKREAKRAHKA